MRFKKDEERSRERKSDVYILVKCSDISLIDHCLEEAKEKPITCNFFPIQNLVL